jgi:SPP1 gp7 family putative phage head morphogenesis protein
MGDPAHEFTEKLIKALEGRLNREYGLAVVELEIKLRDYFERFEKKDETWRKWVDDVKETDRGEFVKRFSDYIKWRKAQMAVGRHWRELKEQLARDIQRTNNEAREIILDKLPDIYAENRNWSMFEVEKGARIDTKFTLFDRFSVRRLLKDNPQILPNPGKKVSRAIANMLAVRWNRQQIQSVMLQGILQGESIPELATRLAEIVGDRNRKAAIRNARTMATGAQNAGRIDSYKYAKSIGVNMKQEWLATLDMRTRHSHRLLDHEVREVGETFSNGCKYPGDPDAPPGEIYNCRCTLRARVAGLEPMARKYRDFSAINGMTYEQWKEDKRKSQSNPIDLPEKKGEAIKWSYIAEYRRKAAETKK